jgi:tRNA 2-thiouridine synthesizing protein D
MSKKELTFSLMDPPYENERTTTSMRLIEIACRRGYNVNVFAYEGAVFVPFSKQTPHANGVHGNTVEEENHPLTHQWVSEVMKVAADNDGKVDWVNCGLCVDERGAVEAVEGVRRGTPGDLINFSESSDGTLVIGTR